MPTRILILCLTILFASCNDINQKIDKFDKKKWDEKVDWDYPYRDDIVDDLIKHHQLKGLSYKQLVDSIGYPENLTDTDGVYYQVVMDFGSDIDPVHTKYLMFKLNKDSMITDFKLKEWKKD